MRICLERNAAASAAPSDATLREVARRQSSDLETDLTSLDLDAPLPEGLFADHVSQGSMRRLVGDRDPATTPRCRSSSRASSAFEWAPTTASSRSGSRIWPYSTT